MFNIKKVGQSLNIIILELKRLRNNNSLKTKTVSNTENRSCLNLNGSNNEKKD